MGGSFTLPLVKPFVLYGSGNEAIRNIGIIKQAPRKK